VNDDFLVNQLLGGRLGFVVLRSFVLDIGGATGGGSIQSLITAFSAHVNERLGLCIEAVSSLLGDVSSVVLGAEFTVLLVDLDLDFAGVLVGGLRQKSTLMNRLSTDEREVLDGVREASAGLARLNVSLGDSRVVEGSVDGDPLVRVHLQHHLNKIQRERTTSGCHCNAICDTSKKLTESLTSGWTELHT
jgi:hypothetical protein